MAQAKLVSSNTTLRSILKSCSIEDVERGFEEFSDDGLYEDYGDMSDYAEAIEILLRQPITSDVEELVVYPYITEKGKCYPEMNLHSVMELKPSIIDAPLKFFVRFSKIKKEHIAAVALYYLSLTDWLDEQRKVPLFS